jgi:hypothetical protein
MDRKNTDERPPKGHMPTPKFHLQCVDASPSPQSPVISTYRLFPQQKHNRHFIDIGFADGPIHYRLCVDAFIVTGNVGSYAELGFHATRLQKVFQHLVVAIGGVHEDLCDTV